MWFKIRFFLLLSRENPCFGVVVVVGRCFTYGFHYSRNFPSGNGNSNHMWKGEVSLVSGQSLGCNCFFFSNSVRDFFCEVKGRVDSRVIYSCLTCGSCCNSEIIISSTWFSWIISFSWTCWFSWIISFSWTCWFSCWWIYSFSCCNSEIVGWGWDFLTIDSGIQFELRT